MDAMILTTTLDMTLTHHMDALILTTSLDVTHHSSYGCNNLITTLDVTLTPTRPDMIPTFRLPIGVNQIGTIMWETTESSGTTSGCR
jgi:hypothetical protein